MKNANSSGSFFAQSSCLGHSVLPRAVGRREGLGQCACAVSALQRPGLGLEASKKGTRPVDCCDRGQSW